MIVMIICVHLYGIQKFSKHCLKRGENRELGKYKRGNKLVHSLYMKNSSLTKRHNELRRRIFPKTYRVRFCHIIKMNLSSIKLILLY
jgi:hypothetical protein